MASENTVCRQVKTKSGKDLIMGIDGKVREKEEFLVFILIRTNNWKRTSKKIKGNVYKNTH